jgi:hypothetical protein
MHGPGLLARVSRTGFQPIGKMKTVLRKADEKSPSPIKTSRFDRGRIVPILARLSRRKIYPNTKNHRAKTLVSMIIDDFCRLK